MKKLFTSIIIAIISCFCLLSLIGCNKEINNITDIERYSDMQLQTDKIEVEYDTNNGSTFNFIIYDKKDIAYIMNIILNDTLKNLGEEPPNGDSGYLTIYQGEKTYELGIRINYEGSYYYEFSSNDLDKKITELAEKAGLNNYLSDD